MPNFITQRMHAYLDYPVAIGLIVLPFLFGLGASHPLALLLSVATGVAAFVLTLLTNHHLGVVKVLPFRLHLAVDLLVGVAFVAAPFLFGFAGIDAAYYWVMGGTVIAVVSMNAADQTAVAA